MLRISNHYFIIVKRFLASKVTPHQEQLMAKSLPKKAPLPGVTDIIVVASGKGGVGKSTIAVNLATTMANMGLKIGLLDGDIFGPSIPLMMNVHEEPLVNEQNLMIPPINYGVKCLSMGLLTKKSDAIIWRGPLVMSALQRLLKGALWGPLDVLIIDTPPGTGDVHLSIAQNVPISGVVLVSTPQMAALEITQRGAQMYITLRVPLLGLIENMGYIICDKCQARQNIFQNNTKKFLQNTLHIELLASIPLNGDITECCDQGVPLILKYQQQHTEHKGQQQQQRSEYVNSFQNAVRKILNKLQQQKQQETNTSNVNKIS